jgi:O-antigen/teichoic acid export membrane protein
MRTVINVLSNWAAFIIGTAISFVLSPLVVHALGDVRYGLWVVIGSVVGYLGLLDLGVRVGVTRFVAHHNATGNQDAVNRVVTTALGMFTVAGAVAIVLGIQLAFLLPWIADVPGSLRMEGSVALAIAGVTMASGLVGGVFGGSIAGLERFALLNSIDLSIELLRAIVIVVVLNAGGGLVAISTIQLLAVTSRSVLYLVAVRRINPGLRISKALLDRSTLVEIFRFSSYTTLLHMSGAVIFSTDAVVIAALMPVSQVTFFAIAASLGQAALQVLGGVSRALYPLISARSATDGTLGATGLMAASIRLGTIAVMPIVLTFLVRGGTFIGLWMGPAYAGPSGAVLGILALGLCVFAGYHIFASNIIALGLHRGLVPAFVLEALANLGLSIALGSVIGIVGVAWGTTLPRMTVALLFAPWFARRHLKLDVSCYAMQAWVRPLASMVPFAVACVIVDHYWKAPNLLTFFLQVALTLPVAAAGAWTVGLEPHERAKLREYLGGMLVARRVAAGGGVGDV